MEKRKRSSSENYCKIAKKLKKLEEKFKKRRRIISSSSESDSDSSHQSLVESDLEATEEIPVDVSEVQNENELATVSVDEDPELNQELLNILGTDPSTEQVFGERLHKDIASRWKHVLVNGLSKEIHTELSKTYLPPENCYTKAPKLNLEIKAALTEIDLKKDLYSQNKQNQIATCLAALGKAVNLGLSKNDQDLLKPLNDAGKILCDLQYKESRSRRFAIINTLNKQTKDTIKDTKIDEQLFGMDLAEQLKSSKAITKSGSELRATFNFDRKKSKKPITSQYNNMRRSALNARGASRAAAAEPRAYPNLRRQTRTQNRQRDATTSRSSAAPHHQRSKKR